MFTASLITLSVLFTLVILNGIFISDLTSVILNDAEVSRKALNGSELRRAAIDRIERNIEERSFLMSLTVGHDESTAIFSYISDAKRHAASDDDQFLAAIDKLIREVERLRMTECFCIDGLI